MAKFVEMDEKETLIDQMEDEVSDPVILIDKFNVNIEQLDRFLNAWKQDATKFKRQPGLVSVQLHKGIGKSGVFINYVVWESMKHYKDAFINVIGANMQSLLSQIPRQSRSFSSSIQKDSCSWNLWRLD
jgi:quinol monooxygenase YgiN